MISESESNINSRTCLGHLVLFKSNNDLTSFTTLRFYVNLDETEFVQLTRLTCVDLFLLKKLGVKNMQLRGKVQN